MQDVVIVSGVRTAIGTFQGALKDKPPTELGTIVTAEALRRADVAPDMVGHVVFGNVIHTEPKDMYLSRVSRDGRGHPEGDAGDDAEPPLRLRPAGGSSPQRRSSCSATPRWRSRGGAESMTRSPHATQAIRSGVKNGRHDLRRHDDRRADRSVRRGHMGITAENVAAQHQISREEQDRFAVSSQQRAPSAIARGPLRVADHRHRGEEGPRPRPVRHGRASEGQHDAGCRSRGCAQPSRRTAR